MTHIHFYQLNYPVIIFLYTIKKGNGFRCSLFTLFIFIFFKSLWSKGLLLNVNPQPSAVEIGCTNNENPAKDDVTEVEDLALITKLSSALKFSIK